MITEVKLFALLALVAAVLVLAHHVVAVHDAAVKAQVDAAYQAQAQKAEAANRTEEQRRVQAQSDIANEAQRMADRARDDALMAASSHDRLLQRAVASVSRPSPVNPPAASGSAPASGPGLLLAKLLGQSSDRSGLLASYADQARVAGLACEASYDSLVTR